MNRLFQFAVLVVGIACLVPFTAGGEEKQSPQPGLVELSGRLRRPVKWTPQIELVPAGEAKRIDVEGPLLRDIQEGTPLRVRGVVRTRLHRGGTEENPSPFPPQWIIWLEVTEVEVLKDVFDVLK